MRKHPFGAGYLGWSDMTELREVFESRILFRWLAPHGGASAQVEKHVQERMSVGHVLAVPNCTQALRLALLATRPRTGDLVYLSAVTFVAAAGAVLSTGLIPVLVDVNTDLALDPAWVPTGAERVIVAHMEGAVGPLPPGVPFVVEDCAQALGGRHSDGRYVGTAGYAGTFSFNHNKMLSSGEGGLIVTDDSERAMLMRAYHDHGSSRVPGEYPTWRPDARYGENLVTNEMVSAVQLQQFRHLDEIVAGLERHYALALEALPARGDLRLMNRTAGDAKWSMRLEAESPQLRDRLLQVLAEEGFTCWTLDRYFLPDHPVLCARHSIYADGFPWNLAPDDLPACSPDGFAATRTRVARVLCIRLEPEIGEDKQIEWGHHLRAVLTAA